MFRSDPLPGRCILRDFGNPKGVSIGAHVHLSAYVTFSGATRQ